MKNRHSQNDSVFSFDSGTLQSYGTNQINDLLHAFHQSIENVEMDNQQYGTSLVELATKSSQLLAKAGISASKGLTSHDDDEDSSIFSTAFSPN